MSVLLFLTLVFISTIWAFPAKDDNGIISVTNANWEEVVKSVGHDVVVEFYSPSCIYCVQFEPTWNEIGRYFKAEDTVLITKVDASRPDGMIPGLEITGVPAVIMYPANRKDKPVFYYSQRSTSRVVEWILENVDLSVEVEISYKSQPLPQNSGPVTEVVGLNWKSVVLNPDKDVFVNFYAPWCPYSNMLRPIWQGFAQRLNGVPSVTIAQFDGTANEVPGLRLEAFPTMTLYRAGSNEQRTYDIRSPRTEEALLNFLQTEALLPFTDPKTGKLSHEIQALSKDHAVDVPELSDSNYEVSVKETNKNVAVLFYAPWCEHSQELFQTWEEIYADFHNIQSIAIYQMDATKHKTANVEIYPTIKIFPVSPDGEKSLEGITFKGKETSEDNIKEFIQTNAVKTQVEMKIEEAHIEANKRGLPPPTEQELEAKYGIDFPDIDYTVGQSLIYRAKEDL